jgi:glutathione S-transferase
MVATPISHSMTPAQATLRLTLVSHHLCPYVQRAAIALAEKGVPFERRWVDLADKPEWFRRLSPLGKVPLLLVGEGEDGDSPSGFVLFESAAIVEYLEDTYGPSLHPADLIERARHRAWMEFGSQALNAIAQLYNAPDAASLDEQAARLSALFERVEGELASREPDWTGPFFAGDRFSLVDAVYGPVFRYFDTFEAAADLHILAGRAHVARWRASLAGRPSVFGAIDKGYSERLTEFLARKGTAISERVQR